LTILTAKSLLIKISKILKYSPGIYKQFLFSSTNSILCSIYGTVQNCKDISPIQIPLHCPAESTSSVLFYEYDGTVPNCWFYETQACAVTLKPALVLYPGKLPVDAAIHALIFRQVNRILDLIQAQVTLRTHTKSSSRFISRQTACWRNYPRTNL